MTRRPTGEYDDDVPLLTGTEVIIDDDAEPTGLLDQYGRKLYRPKPAHPIGFDTNPNHYKPRNKRRGKR